MEFPGIILDLSSTIPFRKPYHNAIYDMMIPGGGSAAMSAAVYAARKMVNLAIVTFDLDVQIRETSEVENYLGLQSINKHNVQGMPKIIINEELSIVASIPEIEFAHAVLKAIGK